MFYPSLTSVRRIKEVWVRPTRPWCPLISSSSLVVELLRTRRHFLCTSNSRVFNEPSHWSKIRALLCSVLHEFIPDTCWSCSGLCTCPGLCLSSDSSSEDPGDAAPSALCWAVSPPSSYMCGLCPLTAARGDSACVAAATSRQHPLTSPAELH